MKWVFLRRCSTSLKKTIKVKIKDPGKKVVHKQTTQWHSNRTQSEKIQIFATPSQHGRPKTFDKKTRNTIWHLGKLSIECRFPALVIAIFAEFKSPFIDLFLKRQIRFQPCNFKAHKIEVELGSHPIVNFQQKDGQSIRRPVLKIRKNVLLKEYFITPWQSLCCAAKTLPHNEKKNSTFLPTIAHWTGNPCWPIHCSDEIFHTLERSGCFAKSSFSQEWPTKSNLWELQKRPLDPSSGP